LTLTSMKELKFGQRRDAPIEPGPSGPLGNA